MMNAEWVKESSSKLLEAVSLVKQSSEYVSMSFDGNDHTWDVHLVGVSVAELQSLADDLGATVTRSDRDDGVYKYEYSFEYNGIKYFMITGMEVDV